MSFHHDPNSALKAMTHLDPEECQILKTLEQDWRRMSGKSGEMIDPNLLDAALPHAFVLRRVGPGTARFAIPLTAPRGFGRKPLRATALMLPMRDSEGEMTRMLGAIVTNGDVTKKVHQFDVDHTIEMRCETLEGNFPDRRTGPRSRPTETEPQTPKRGHLRLVVDNSAA